MPAGTSWLASVFASTVPYFRDSGQLISNWAQSMMLCASVREMRKLSPPAPYGYETQTPCQTERAEQGRPCVCGTLDSSIHLFTQLFRRRYSEPHRTPLLAKRCRRARVRKQRTNKKRKTLPRSHKPFHPIIVILFHWTSPSNLSQCIIHPAHSTHTTQKRSPLASWLAFGLTLTPTTTQVLLMLPWRQAAHIHARVWRPGAPVARQGPALALHHDAVRVLRRQGRQPVLLCVLVLPVRRRPRRGYVAGKCERFCRTTFPPKNEPGAKTTVGFVNLIRAL